MQSKQINSLRSLENIGIFIEEHPQLAAVRNTGAYLRFCQYKAALSVHALDQSDLTLAVRESLGTQASCKRVLLKVHMAPIARIARLDLPQIPELDALRMPPMSIAPPRLVVAARAMGRSAARYTDTFAASGLQHDFVAQLDAAADALHSALHRRDQSRGKGTGATKGLREKLSRSRKVVVVLDALIQNALADDEVLLRNWRQVMRVQKTGARAATSDTPAVAAA